MNHTNTRSLTMSITASGTTGFSPAYAALLVFALILVWFPGESSGVIPSKRVSGYVVNYRDGSPMASAHLSVHHVVPDTIASVETNSGGYYFFDVPLGSSVVVYPSLDVGHPWNNYIWSDPEALWEGNITENVQLDTLVVKPGVLVNFAAPGDAPSVEGYNLVYSNPPARHFVVDTLSRGDDKALFFPDDFSDAIGPMPYSGELRIVKNNGFVEVFPQTQYGLNILFDCEGKYLDGDNPVINYQWILAKEDLDISYSWEDSVGLGWEFFPKTPDNRLPNNPNVYVEAPLGFTWKKEDIRILGNEATEDVNYANDYTAKFAFPIPECGPLDLRLEYKLTLQNGTEAWYELDTHKSTSASDGNLALPDTSIGLDDVSAFNRAFNSCLGDTNYNACANYNPNEPTNCINLSDLTEFSSIYYYNKNNKNMPVPISGHEVDIVGVEDGYDVYLTPNCVYDVAVIELGIEFGLDLRWTPSSEYESRSVGEFFYPESGDPTFLLIVIGGIPSGETLLGSLVGSAGNKAKSPMVYSVEFGNSIHESVNRPMAEGLPEFKLLDCYPNPFNPETTIGFLLTERASVGLAVYDISGKVVRTLVNGKQFPSGQHEYRWNGLDNAGRKVSSGTYFYKLDIGNDTVTKRMTLIK